MEIITGEMVGSMERLTLIRAYETLRDLGDGRELCFKSANMQHHDQRKDRKVCQCLCSPSFDHNRYDCLRRGMSTRTRARACHGDFPDRQRNLVLICGTGTGKTHLAVSIARGPYPRWTTRSKNGVA